MTTSLDNALGLRQGRVLTDPLGAGGGPVVVLGDAAAGMRAWLATGDGVALTQDVVLGGESLVVATVRTRADTASWELGWDIAGVPRAWVPVPPGDGAASVAAVVGDLVGPASLALVLRCVAGGPEVELPTVVVREVTLAAAAAPVVLNPVPAAGATAVPRTTRVAVSIVDPTQGRLDVASVQVWIDGVAAVVAGGVVRPFNGSGATVTPEVRGIRVTLVPLQPFASRAAVAVRVAARTTDGRTVDQPYAFQVEDREAPTLIAAFQVDLTQVELVFDEPVGVTPVAAVRVVPRTGPAVATSLGDLVAAGRRLRGHLAQPLTNGVAYDVVVDGVVDLGGNAVMPGTRAPLVVAAVAAHRLALWLQLPRVLRRSDTDGHLQRLVACWQDVVDLLVARDDLARRQLDPRTADAATLDVFLADLGSPFPYALDTDGKRRLVLALAAMYRLKGTAPGLEAGLRFMLGLGARVRPFAQDAARLGRARLGRDFRLAPAARFARYAFELEVDRVLTDAERQAVRWWVTWHKPAHTHLTRIREPGPAPVRAAWRLGHGALGQTTFVGAA